MMRGTRIKDPCRGMDRRTSAWWHSPAASLGQAGVRPDRRLQNPACRPCAPALKTHPFLFPWRIRYSAALLLGSSQLACAEGVLAQPASYSILPWFITVLVGLAMLRRSICASRRQKSCDQLEALFDSLPEAIYVKDRHGRWIRANRAGIELFRLQDIPWHGKTSSELAALAPRLVDVLEILAERERLPVSTAEASNTEIDICKANGEIRNFQFRKYASGKDGLECTLVLRDVTLQAQISGALQASEMRHKENAHVLQTIIDTLPANVALLDRQGALIAINRHCKDLCDGYCDLLSLASIQNPAMRTCPHMHGLPMDCGMQIRSGILSVLEGQASQFVHEYPQPGAHPRVWLRLMAVPIQAEDSIQGIVVMSTDITEFKDAEEAIRASEQQYRTMTENSPDMIARVGMNGDILFANRALAYYLESEGAADSNILDLFPPTAHLHWQRAVAQVLAQGLPRVDFMFEAGMQPEVRGFQAYVVAELCEQRGVVSSLLVVLRDVTELRKSELQLLRSRRLLRMLAASQETVREEEKKAIARELHDELGQVLNALAIDIGLTDMQHGRQWPHMSARYKRMLELIDHARKSMRSIITNLRPTVLDLGLIPALEWLQDDYGQRFGFACRLHVRDPLPELEDEQVTAIFRIVQESLTNVARHSQASIVGIQLMLEGNKLHTVIQDDGCGFELNAVSQETQHFGLLGMGERALALGGTLDIQSGPGQGCCIVLKLPLDASRGVNPENVPEWLHQ